MRSRAELTSLVVALLFALVQFACGKSGSSTAQHPEDLPPLPPPTSTSVSLLIERETDLRLTAEQAQRLKILDEKLENLNAPLQTRLDEFDRERERVASAMAKRREEKGKGRGGKGGGKGGGGKGGGGMGGGGMGGGGMGGGGMSGGGDKAGRGSRGGRGKGAGGEGIREEMLKQRAEAQAVHQQMSDNHAAVLAEALCALDERQRDAGRRLLEGEGYEVPQELLCGLDAEDLSGGAEPSAEQP